MIPIALCGIIATYICIERLLFFATTGKEEKALVKKIPAVPKEACTGETPCGQVLRTVYDIREKNGGRPLSCAEKDLLQTALDTSAALYEKHIATLNTISSVATLLGLLGTVTGNIKAFSLLGGGTGLGDTAALARSISEALVTTAGGLCVAIPALLLGALLSALAKKAQGRLEDALNRMLYFFEQADLGAAKK